MAVKKSDCDEGRTKLSDEERIILSEGLIRLMNSVRELRSILYDEEVNRALDAYVEKVQKLNDKICLRMD